MAFQTVAKGATDVSLVIRILDSSDGTPETGVTSGTTGLDLEYARQGAASVDITESNLSALTDSHSDGGMLHIGNGYYRIDVPDAAFASGADWVLIHGTATGMVVVGTHVQLVQSLTVDSNGVVEANVVQVSDDSTTADNLETAYQSTLAEPTGAPSATEPIWVAIKYLLNFGFRNKRVADITSGTGEVRYYDDGGAVEFESDVTVSSGVTTINETGAPD